MLFTRISVAIFICLTYMNVLHVLCDLYTSDINLQQGTVRGINFGGYNAYLGVPYASVPVRFQEPGPAPSWPGTFYATDGNIKCNQILPVLNVAVGREDCLVANIYTPNTNQIKELLPVMVFIHGGGFQFGSNTVFLYDAKYLAQKGVIVVAINYRLGAFGFLCLNKTEASGNMGLKDQIAALQWINRNIESFGGDPQLVTLVGESAGATSVQYITMSELGKGLFKRSILESGSILVPIGFDENPLDKAIFLTSKLGYNTTDPNEILKILLNTDAMQLTKASTVEKNYDVYSPFIFQACAENVKISRTPFLTTTPRELLKSSTVDPELSIIMGVNNKEGIMFAGQFNDKGMRDLEKDLSVILPHNLIFKNKNDMFKVLENIRTLYFENKPLTSASYDGLINYYSDCIIIYPTLEVAENYLKGNATVFNYIFKYGSLRNLNKFSSGLPFTPGANHADELFYIFDPIFYKMLPSLPRDKRIIDFMTDTWTSFAKTGVPSSQGINWMRSEKDNMNFLSIDKNNIQMTAAPFEKRMNFWKDLYQKYGSY